MAAPEYRRMVVSAVRDDGNVNLEWGGTLVDAGGDGIPAMDSYVNRAEGDNVLVLVDEAGLFVIGKAGPGTGAGPVSWSQILDKPDLSAEGVANVPDPKDLDADSAVLWQNSWGGWHRTTAINDGRPVQGNATGAPANEGGWFYGSKISDACTGHTASGMWLTLNRISAYHGNPRGAYAQLYLMSPGSATSTPPSMSNHIRGPWLQCGARTAGKGFQLPSDWVSALASGSSQSIGVQAPGGNNGYIEFGDCGGIHIEFSA